MSEMVWVKRDHWCNYAVDLHTCLQFELIEHHGTDETPDEEWEDLWSRTNYYLTPNGKWVWEINHKYEDLPYLPSLDVDLYRDFWEVDPVEVAYGAVCPYPPRPIAPLHAGRAMAAWIMIRQGSETPRKEPQGMARATALERFGCNAFGCNPHVVASP
jgi:hypothetical protein